METKTKTCTKCGGEKLLDDYYLTTDGKKSNHCKRCHHRRCEEARILRIYGLTWEEYEALLASQDGGCAICGTKIESDRNRSKLQIDHCHATNDIRGILCGKCNRGIASFDDNPALLRAAIEYIERHHRAVRERGLLAAIEAFDDAY